MTAFIESPRFPEAISFGSAGGPTWNTNIVVTDSGAEIRNQRWSYPRHGYDVAYGIKDRSDLEDLLSFFHVVAGQAIGFRYKDHVDFKSCKVDATVNSSDCVISSAADGASTSYQIYKTYTQGSYTRSRKILKPISSAVVVSVNGSNTTAFTVDTTLGKINFTFTPGVGHVIKAGFEFDVPCRFNTDTMSVNLDDYKVGSAQAPLIELKWADT
jgi:uncharacterized protein (TIGR02217 family)